jgi:hypothetical protein
MNDLTRLDDRNSATVIGPPPARPVIPSTPNLAKALAAAQQKCRAVSKDAKNSYHAYKYASAEAIIAEAKAALADTGLALAPIEQQVEESGGRYQLHRRFLLTHESGECLPLSVSWPVMPDRGRPLDKAAGAAATSSLSYLLRDLLMMPRVDGEDDVAARADKSQPVADRATTEQLTKIREYKNELGIGDDDWKSILAKRGVESARDLTDAQADELVKALAHRVATKQIADGLQEAERKGGAAQAETKNP